MRGVSIRNQYVSLTYVTNLILVRPRRFFPGLNRDNRIPEPGIFTRERGAAARFRRDGKKRRVFLFVYLSDLIAFCLLLMSTTRREKEAENGGKEKKARKHIVIAARRAAVSIAREARLVSNLTRRGARRKLTAVEGDGRFSIGAP